MTGRCGIVEYVPAGCFYPDLLIRIEFDTDKIRPEFACIQWNYGPVHTQLIRRAKSTSGIWKINGQDLRQHRLVVPPIEEQDEFLFRIAPIQQAIEQVFEQIDTVQELKNSLLGELLDSSTGRTFHV